MRPLFVLIFAALLLPACDSDRPGAKTPFAEAGQAAAKSTVVEPSEEALRTARFLDEPVKTGLLEYPTAALPLWRSCRELRPTLVLLSNDPFLEPVPAALKEEAGRLLRQGSDGELRDRTVPWSPDPLLMPSMAVDAALRAGFFGKVVWVLPTNRGEEELSADAFRKQLLELGAIDETESATLRREEGGFSGTIRGVPWTAVPWGSFKGVEGPAVVHIDLSFLRPLYRNEIRTPLYPLVGDLFKRLRETGLQTCAVTVSLSQAGGQVSLDTRFLGTDMAAIIGEPSLLDRSLPSGWVRRGEILYLQNFFQKERVHGLTAEMKTESPKDPFAHFAHYRSCREMKAGGEALAALARAVALDRIYALEYLNLAAVAQEKELPEEALRMFALAERSFPDNPFIRLEKARLHLSLGQGKEASKLLDSLEKLPWSPAYYPELPEVIAREKRAALQGS